MPNLNSAGPLYADNQAMFQGKNIINIDRHLTNGFFGTINFVNKTSSSTSELALKTLQALQVELDRDIATNLYAGISAATNNFTAYSVNAETFETIATLLKAGAMKKSFKPPVPTASPVSQGVIWYVQAVGAQKRLNKKWGEVLTPSKPQAQHKQKKEFLPLKTGLNPKSLRVVD